MRLCLSVCVARAVDRARFGGRHGPGVYETVSEKCGGGFDEDACANVIVVMV